MKKIVLLIFFQIVFPSLLWAACGGSSPNWTAADTSQAEVEACITAASAGDTITIPAGTSTWATRVEISKQLIFQGQGDTTHIDGYGFYAPLNVDGWEIHGIYFHYGVKSQNNPAIRIGTDNNSSSSCQDYVIENNTFEGGAGAIAIWGAEKGLIANNYFKTETHALTNIYIFGHENAAWITDQRGTAENVFVEDNLFECAAYGGTYNYCNHAILGGWGAAYVFRANHVKDASYVWYDTVDTHGYGHGTNRGARSAEVYANRWTFAGNHDGAMMQFRGGTGIAYENDYVLNGYTYGNNRGGAGVYFYEYREASGALSLNQPVYSPKDCTSYSGTASGDDQCTNREGYPCCDQVGRGSSQALDPMYFWHNYHSGTSTDITDVVVTASSGFIVEGRDYYMSTSLSNAVSNGLSVGYAPYTYPHPDRGLGATYTALSGANSQADTGITFWVAGDTTAPACTISTGDPQAVSSDSVTLQGTCTDAVGVTAIKARVSSAPDASNGSSCTCDDGTCNGTSEAFTCVFSGLSEGANTVYVGAGDAAANWSTGADADSITVNYTIASVVHSVGPGTVHSIGPGTVNVCSP